MNLHRCDVASFVRLCAGGVSSAGLCLIVSLGASSPARDQAGSAPTSQTPAQNEDVNVMTEFKVYDKKPVPFTDANMDIPRGVNDVQPYYVIGPEEIENSGKSNLEEVMRDNLTQNTVVE